MAPSAAKKKTAKKAGAKKSASKKVDPFKTRKTRTVDPKANDTVSPPKAVAKAVDAFREAQEQMKHFEGEMTVQKDIVMDYGNQVYSERLSAGTNKSFKLMGDETMVTYVAMDASSGLTEEDVESFRERWGDEAADELIGRDYGSIRFDPKVLEAHYDQVVEALQGLPEHVLEKLFKTMLMRARPGAADAARKHTQSPEDLAEILKDLKMRHYIR